MVEQALEHCKSQFTQISGFPLEQEDLTVHTFPSHVIDALEVVVTDENAFTMEFTDV